MNNFKFNLKNEKIASYKKSILAIIGLNLIFFTYLTFAAENYRIRNAAIIAIGFIILSFVIKSIYHKKTLRSCITKTHRQVYLNFAAVLYAIT